MVLDDEIDAGLRQLLEALFVRLGGRLGRKPIVDYAPTWNTRGLSPAGRALFRENAYELVVLDMVFDEQAHQGYEIYESIRSGEALGCESSDTRCRVPIVLFSCGEGEAKVAISIVSTSARYAHTFILYKEQLLGGTTVHVEESLVAHWTGRDLVLHVSIPSGQNAGDAVQGLAVHFCQLGAGPPQISAYERPLRHGYQILLELTSPDEPRGKKDWACIIYEHCHYLTMSLSAIGKVFERQTGRVLQWRHPNGQKGWKKLNGIEEIHLHFDEPGLFGLNEDCMILSSRAGERLFVPEGLWPSSIVGARIEER